MVRFWAYGNDGLVRLALSEGSTLVHRTFTRTDEGWSSTCEAWTLEGDIVVREYGTDGVDCDGRLSYVQTDECPVSELAAEPAYDAPEYRVPRWRNVDRSQRDYSAEAMGY